ncbi:hypothetical protein XA68_18355 [Ophiocordyceps unilateralis]|uniref:Uncharacterized protein n=1 Tax=Ophiocordyceps unilateralis TaxID=268505 RepID=A0A2A9PI64_OPHUN|nr:hypothetical protein XA68_18355 [Ophiocordyceps unilateralis]
MLSSNRNKQGGQGFFLPQTFRPITSSPVVLLHATGPLPTPSRHQIAVSPLKKQRNCATLFFVTIINSMSTTPAFMTLQLNQQFLLNEGRGDEWKTVAHVGDLWPGVGACGNKAVHHGRRERMEEKTGQNFTRGKNFFSTSGFVEAKKEPDMSAQHTSTCQD